MRGGNELIESFRNKLENDIGTNYSHFEQENGNKRKFIEVMPIKYILFTYSCIHAFGM